MKSTDRQLREALGLRLYHQGIKNERLRYLTEVLTSGAPVNPIQQHITPAVKEHPDLFERGADLLTWAGRFLIEGDDLHKAPPPNLSKEMRQKTARLARSEDEPHRIVYEVLLYCDGCAHVYRSLAAE